MRLNTVIDQDLSDRLSIRELAAEAQAKIDAGVILPGDCDRLTHALVVAGYCQMERKIHVSFGQ
jgi:hypothetical protein